MATSTLTKARQNKADEFYTQLPDIEAEMRHYRDQFKGKSVLCNCDDPYESNFFKYFALNFNFLGLRKLVATCYAGSSVMQGELDLFGVPGVAESDARAKTPYKIEITEVPDANADGATDLADVAHLLKNRRNALALLDGDGDFRSRECVELMKQADIVATNPPFSLFREYVAQLIALDKKFIVLGNQNAVSYREIFTLFQRNLVWKGYHCGDMEFVVPSYYEAHETRFRVGNDGVRYRSLGNICWYTNLDVAKRHEFMTLYCNYTPDAYPRYANYDAIEVSKTSEIPCDFDGAMGVPITFLDKYNPEQFEIVGASRFLGRPMSEIAPKGTFVAGGVRFYLPNGDGTYRRLFDRIVIRRKGSAT